MKSSRPLEPIGVCLRPEYDEYSLDRVSEYSRMAEANGFHSVWLAESWGLDAIALLSHIGARTDRVKLGTAIVNVFSRTPSLLSMASATINDLCPGRFILGLGASTKALVEDWHGMSFTRPVSRLRDAVEIVRRATAGEEVNYQGTEVSVKGYRLRVKPRSAPPPIYLAALSPNSMKVVAELADGWLPYLLPMRGVSDSAAKLRNAAKTAGRAPDAIRIAPMVVTAVSHDADAARTAARKHLAFYLGAMGPHYRAFASSFGFETEVELIKTAWSAKDHPAAARAVTDEMVDEFSISGTPQECREKLVKMRAAGVDLPILFFPGTCTNDMVELALETLGSAGAPRS